MSNDYIHRYIIAMLYKMLCWREEKKNWEKLYDELIIDITSNETEDKSFLGLVLMKVVPLRYLDEEYFRKRIFEVLSYLNGLSKLS